MHTNLNMVSRSVGIAVFAVCLMILPGCNISFQQDPAKTVTVVISGIPDGEASELIHETLIGMVDGSSHMLNSRTNGNEMTVSLSPVSDVKKFSKKINFGKVSSVEGRTVKVDYVP